MTHHAQNYSAYKPNITQANTYSFMSPMSVWLLPSFYHTIDWPAQPSIMKMQFYAR